MGAQAKHLSCSARPDSIHPSIIKFAYFYGSSDVFPTDQLARLFYFRAGPQIQRSSPFCRSQLITTIKLRACWGLRRHGTGPWCRIAWAPHVRARLPCPILLMPRFLSHCSRMICCGGRRMLQQDQQQATFGLGVSAQAGISVAAAVVAAVLVIYGYIFISSKLKQCRAVRTWRDLQSCGRAKVNGALPGCEFSRVASRLPAAGCCLAVLHLGTQTAIAAAE